MKTKCSNHERKKVERVKYLEIKSDKQERKTYIKLEKKKKIVPVT